MNVQTFDLVIWFKDDSKIYYNISRTAVKYYLDWYKESPDFDRYAVLEA